MDNELIRQKSWWQRNGKWLVPLMVLAVAGVILLVNLADGAGDFGRAYTDMPLFENALQQANNNKEVQNALGNMEPIDRLTIAEGNVVYVGDSISTTVTVKGIKGKGKIDIAAVKDKGIWNYRLIQIRIKEPKQEIVVLAE